MSDSAEIDAEPTEEDNANGVPIRVQNKLTVESSDSVTGSIYLEGDAKIEGDGNSSVTQMDTVATVSGFPYADLGAALTAAKNGTVKEVVLAASDDPVELTQAIGKSVTRVVPNGVTLEVPADDIQTVMTGKGVIRVIASDGLTVGTHDMLGASNNGLVDLQLSAGVLEMDLNNLSNGISVSLKDSAQAAVPEDGYTGLPRSTIQPLTLPLRLAPLSPSTASSE